MRLLIPVAALSAALALAGPAAAQDTTTPPLESQVDLGIAIAPERVPAMLGEVVALRIAVVSNGDDVERPVVRVGHPGSELVGLRAGAPAGVSCVAESGATLVCTLPPMRRGGPLLFDVDFTSRSFVGQLKTDASVSSGATDVRPADNWSETAFVFAWPEPPADGSSPGGSSPRGPLPGPQPPLPPLPPRPDFIPSIPPPPAGPAPAFLTLAAAPSLRLPAPIVSVTSLGAGVARAALEVRVPGRPGLLRVTSAPKTVRSQRTTSLRLRATGATLRALRRALRGRRGLPATVVATVETAATPPATLTERRRVTLWP